MQLIEGELYTLQMTANFENIKYELLKKLLNKNSLDQNDLENLIQIHEFTQGKSGAAVSEVESFLSIPQIEGRTILKITPTSAWPDFIEEVESYHNSGNIKPIFAELVWSTTLEVLINNSLKKFTCSFWKRAHDMHPLSEMKPLNELNIQKEINTALHLAAKRLLECYQLQNPIRQMSFSQLCHDTLGYRIAPKDGHIYDFAHTFLNISFKTPTFRWNGIDFSDPLFYVNHAKNIFLTRVYRGETHGDMHGGNIFALIKNGQAQDICLIDAGLTSNQHPIFYDQAYLEVSQLINSDIARQIDDDRWVKIFSAISQDFLYDSDQIQVASDDIAILKQIRAIRDAFAQYLKQNDTLASSLEQQYRVMQICAALNFCNKRLDSPNDELSEADNNPFIPQGRSQRRFAYLLSSFLLKSYLLKYGDDPQIAELKRNINSDSNYLLKEELQQRSLYESVWTTWGNTDVQKQISLPDLFKDYEQLKHLKSYNRIPTYMTIQYAKLFIHWVFLKAYPLCKTDIEKTKLFGFLGLSIQDSISHYRVLMNDRDLAESYLQEFEKIHYLEFDEHDLLNWIQFAFSIIEDYLFQNNQDQFKSWISRIQTLLEAKKLSQITREKIKNQLIYYQGFNISSQLNLKELKILLENWHPENDKEPQAEWFIKKSFLMATCFSQSMAHAFNCIALGLKSLDLWPFQEQVYFLEAYLYLRKSFRTDYSSPPEDELYNQLKAKGVWSIHQWFEDYLTPSINKKEKEHTGAGYHIVYRDQEPTQAKQLMSLKCLVLLFKSGLLPQIWNLSFVSADTWSTINKHVSNYYPQLCFFYSVQYILKNHIDAAWLREQIRTNFLSENALPFFEQLLGVHQEIHSQDSRFSVLILALLSEFTPKIPPQNWLDLFNEIWDYYHQPKYLEIIYSQVKQGPFLFIKNALSKVSEKEILQKCLFDLLITDNNFDADAYVRPEFLYEIIKNPVFEQIEFDSTFETKIQNLINDIPDVNLANYSLKKLSLIDSKLTKNQLDMIAEQILNLTQLPGFKSTLFSLVSFTKGYPQSRKHIHDLILADGKTIWNTGLVKDEQGRWSKNLLGDSLIHFHEMKYKPTFQEGIIWAQDEILKIYQFLKLSIDEFKKSPFCPKNSLASKTIFLNGLDFYLLKEMKYFLDDYADVLRIQDDYVSLKEEIMAGIQEHAPSTGRPSDLISDNPNTVKEGIDQLRNLMLERHFEQVPEYWYILLSKVLTQQEPHLLTCLNLMSFWIVYYRHEEVLTDPSYLNSYQQILDKYQVKYPDSDQPDLIEICLLKLAMVMQFWGKQSPSISHFLSLSNDSIHEKVRDLYPLDLQETYKPGLEVSENSKNKILSQLDINSFQLVKIVVQGFKSFSSQQSVEIELKNLNVLIGANGAGKSSFLSLFSFIKAFSNQPLESSVTKLGSVDDFLYYGSKYTSQFSGKLIYSNGNTELSYSFSCSPNESNTTLFFNHESIRMLTENSEDISLIENSEFHPNSILMTMQDHPPVKFIRDKLQDIQEFHIHDTSLEAKLRKLTDYHNTNRLDEEASNLAAILYSLKTSSDNRKNYNNIIRFIRKIFPQFHDFVMEPNFKTERIKLEWTEVGSNHRFAAHQASDGTLRFIALATLLNQSSDVLPKLLFLDEPELGLHPKALSVLAGMLSLTDQYSQLVIATQSGEFLNQFSADHIIVVERTRFDTTNNEWQDLFATNLVRKSSEELHEWLDEYTLSELWDKNIIGGKP